jgi:arsenite-transporting ATPase
VAHEWHNKQILLFSTDPAHSLSDCLKRPIQSEPTRVSENLAAMEVDAQAAFDNLKQQYAQEVEDLFQSLSHRIDMPFDRGVMEHLMDLSPPGIDEVIALRRVMVFLIEGKYDVLILDTAPTGHLIRFLELPALIDQWLKTLFALFLKYKHIFRLPKLFEQLLNLSKDLKRWRAMLHDADQSVLYGVTILEEMAFQETKDLIAATERMGIKVPGLFLNLATQVRDDPLSMALHEREFSIKDKFIQAFPKQQQTLVYRRGEPHGISELETLGKALYRF